MCECVSRVPLLTAQLERRDSCCVAPPLLISCAEWPALRNRPRTPCERSRELAVPGLGPSSSRSSSTSWGSAWSCRSSPTKRATTFGTSELTGTLLGVGLLAHAVPVRPGVGGASPIASGDGPSSCGASPRRRLGMAFLGLGSCLASCRLARSSPAPRAASPPRTSATASAYIADVTHARRARRRAWASSAWPSGSASSSVPGIGRSALRHRGRWTHRGLCRASSAAALSLVNFLWVFITLRESLPPRDVAEEAQPRAAQPHAAREAFRSRASHSPSS